MSPRLIVATAVVLVLCAGRASAQCNRPPLNTPQSEKRNLDDAAADWGVYCEGAPTWTLQTVTEPSVDGSALQLSITGGGAGGYQNAYFYRSLTSEPRSTSFTMTESFRFPATTFNNEGVASVVQGLEFSMSKYLGGRRWEWALQWENVGSDGAPVWRYWTGSTWVSLNIPDRLAPDVWHSLTLNGEIVGGQVHYESFVIDGRSHVLGQTVPPVATPDADQLTVAVQLDANANQAAYAVQIDQVNLSGWARSCGDGRVNRVIDTMDDVSKWSVWGSDRGLAQVMLRPVPGCNGSAVAIDYNLNGAYPSGANWLIAQRQFDPPLDLTDVSHLRAALTGSDINAHHNVEFKLADQSNNVDWYVSSSAADLPVWRTIFMDLRQMECFGDAATCTGRPPLDLAHIARIEIAVSRCLRIVNGTTEECEQPSQNVNVLSIDELAGVDLRPGAAFRLAPAAREHVTPNATMRAAAARSLRDMPEQAGLVPAWNEEPIANYNTYAQALRILVMVREYELTGDDTWRQAAERATAAMLAVQRAGGTANAGAWFTAYEWNGTRLIARDGCQGTETITQDVDRCFWVGNTGWMLIALDRVRSALPGSHAAVEAAIDRAADWIVGKMGRLSDVPDVVTYGLEGNISAYFGLVAARRPTDAARLGAAVFTFGWDATEQRMKIGVLPWQMGSAMDTAGSWGAFLLRSLGKEAEARASQSYIASMLRTSSFDGMTDGYGDIEGPWTVTVEFGAQGAEAGIAGADQVMANLASLQAPDGLFPGSPDAFSGAGAWITPWHGVAPTATMHFALAGGPLATLTRSSLLFTAAASPSVLNFRHVRRNGALQYATPSQQLSLALNVAGPITWTATGSQPWITVSPSSGSGPATLTVSTTDAAGASGELSGLVTIRTAGVTEAVLTANVRLTIQSGLTTSLPFGSFDTPAAGSSVAGSIAVTGWALDDIEVSRVEIWRDKVDGETTPGYPGPGPGTGKVFIANAFFVPGARPDVATTHRLSPQADRAGWGYLLLTQGLWNQGNGTYTLYAFAYDREIGQDGEVHSTTLGSKVITATNATATKPFGSIDVPAYGQTMTTSFYNFGWALTPNATPTCTIPANGVRVSIDSGPLQPVSYGDLRTDIAEAFPGFSNGGGAGGAYYIDTTTLANGTHQIGWYVVDNCNRDEGIGSRFFNVLNGATDATTAHSTAPNPAASGVASASRWTEAIEVRRGSHLTRVHPGASGTRLVPIAQGERVEMRLPGIDGATYTGYQVVNGQRRGLPLGSSLDGVQGIFYWHPAAGFLGAHDLEFVSGDGHTVRVRVVIGTSVHAVIDTPLPGVVTSPFVVAGWAIEEAAVQGTGIDAVHVWAHPADGGDAIFLGVAAYGDARADIAAMFGAQFAGASYSLTVDRLAPGTYDVVVYPHSVVGRDFRGAQVVRVTVH